MSTEFPEWEDVLKSHILPKKKVLLLVSLFNPVYPALTLEETHKKFPKIDIVMDLIDTIDQFNADRYDGARMELLTQDWNNTMFVIGLSCNETTDPIKLFSSNISRALFNKWKPLVKTRNRLFSVEMLDYPDNKTNLKKVKNERA
jgi:hypothetical protein